MAVVPDTDPVATDEPLYAKMELLKRVYVYEVAFATADQLIVTAVPTAVSVSPLGAGTWTIGDDAIAEIHPRGLKPTSLK